MKICNSVDISASTGISSNRNIMPSRFIPVCPNMHGNR